MRGTTARQLASPSRLNGPSFGPSKYVPHHSCHYSTSCVLTESQSNQAWGGKIRVDGVVISLFGEAQTAAVGNVTSVQITPTRSIFVVHAGPMNVTVTFPSPIEVRLSDAYKNRRRHTNSRRVAFRLSHAVDAILISSDRNGAIGWPSASGVTVYRDYCR